MKQEASTSAMRGVLTFILGSLFGIVMFLWPVNSGDAEFATGLSVINDAITALFEDIIMHILVVVAIISALGSVWGLVAKEYIRKHLPWIATLLVLPWPYVLTRVIAAIVGVCVFWEIGPEYIRSADTGGGMMDLSKSLFSIAFSLSFILPFLTDCGLMEFAGILLRPITRPLFKVPGRASIDLIASWLASSNTAVLITGGQYHAGFYTQREAAVIMTNFSLVSIPFCMVVAEAMKLDYLFLPFYGIITAIGLVLAMIGARIWPLASIPNTFKNNVSYINESIPDTHSLFQWAFVSGVKRASNFNVMKAFRGALSMALSIIFDLIPIVIAWGTVGSLIVNYTPFFHWISYPMGWYMDLFGVPEAYTVAPASVVGFIDMFIPVLITGTDLPELTRFVIAGLSVVQIIYMTEVGSIIIKSEVGLNIGKLFVIFLVRTIIAIPLLVWAGRWLLGV